MALRQYKYILFLLSSLIFTDLPKAQSVCDIYHIQNNLYDTLQKFTSIGLKHGVNVISQSLKGGKNMSLKTFLSASDASIYKIIKDDMLAYFNHNLDTNALVVLDIEHPVAPDSIGYYPASLRDSIIIYGFKRRIEIARKILPNAQLALYGVIVPVGNGKVSTEQLSGFRRAQQLGMFDSLDIICPVLYSRFQEGKGNVAFKNQINNGIIYARDSLATGKEIMPLLSCVVANSGVDGGDWLLSSRALDTYNAVQSYSGISKIGYWTNNPYYFHEKNPALVPLYRDSLYHYFADSLALLPIADFSYTKKNGTLSLTSLSIKDKNYFWDFGDGTTDNTSSPPPHTYNNPGTYSISLIVSDDYCSDTLIRKISILSINAIQEDNIKYEIQVYPNPSRGLINIQSTSNIESIVIFNSLGEKVFTQFSPKESTDINTLSAGVYTIGIEINKQWMYKKLVLEK